MTTTFLEEAFPPESVTVMRTDPLKGALANVLKDWLLALVGLLKAIDVLGGDTMLSHKYVSVPGAPTPPVRVMFTTPV